MSGDWRREQHQGGRADNEVEGDGLWPGKRARTQPRGPDHDIDPGKRSPSQALKRKPGREHFDRAIAEATSHKERLAIALAANSFEQAFAAATALRAALKAATNEIANNQLGLDARASLTSVEATAQTLLGQAPVISEQAYRERMSGRGNKPRPEWERAERDWLASRGRGSANGGLADSVHHVLDTEPGSALTDAGAWSNRVGSDVSDARVVTGPAASSAAADLGARAFTVGHRVFFGAGHDASTDGGDLLEHELHHVVQQRGASEPGSWNDLAVLDHDDSLEVAAREGRGGGHGGMAIARDSGKTAPKTTAAPDPKQAQAMAAMVQNLPQVTSRWKAIGADLFTNAEKPVKVPTVAMFEPMAYGLVNLDIVDIEPVNQVLMGPNREDHLKAFHRAGQDVVRDKPHADAIQEAVTNIVAGGQIQFNTTRLMADQAAMSRNGQITLALKANPTVGQLARYAAGDAFKHGEMESPTEFNGFVKHEGNGKPRKEECEALVRLLQTGAAPPAQADASTKTQPSVDDVKKSGELMKTVTRLASAAGGRKSHALTAAEIGALTIALEQAGPEARELVWKNKAQVSKIVRLLDAGSAQLIVAGLDPVESLYHKCESLVGGDEAKPGDAWLLKANQASGMLNAEAREAIAKQMKLKAGGSVYTAIRAFLLAHTAEDQQPTRMRLLQHTKLKNVFIDRLPPADSRIIYRLIVRGTEAPSPEDMVHEAAEKHDGVGIVTGLRALANADPVKLAALERDPVFRSLIEKQTQEVVVDGLKVRPYQLCMTMWGRKVGENLDPNAVARVETNPDKDDTPLTIPERIKLDRELLDKCVDELWAEISGANFKGDDYERAMALAMKRLGDPQAVRDTLVKFDHLAISAPYLQLLRRAKTMWSAEVEKRFYQKHNQDLRAWVFEHSGPVNKAGAMRVLGLEQGAGVGMFNGQVVAAGGAAKDGKMPLAQALRETVFGGMSLAEICSVQSRVLATAIDNENQAVAMVAFSNIKVPVDVSAKALLDLTGISVRAIDLVRNAFAEHSGHFETRLAAKFSGKDLADLEAYFGLTADVDKVEGAAPPSLDKQGDDRFSAPAKQLWDAIATIRPGVGAGMLAAATGAYRSSTTVPALDSPRTLTSTPSTPDAKPKGSTVAVSVASGEKGHDIEERPPRTFRGYYQLHYGVAPLLHMAAAVRALGDEIKPDTAADVLGLVDPDRAAFIAKVSKQLVAEDEDGKIGPHNIALVRASFTETIAAANAHKIWEILHSDGKLQLIEAELYGPYNDEEQRLIRVHFRKLSGGFDLTFYVRQAILARQRMLADSKPGTTMSVVETIGGTSAINGYMRAEAAKQQASSLGGEGTEAGDLMFTTIRTMGDDAELDRALSVTTKGEVDARTRVRNAVQRKEDGQVLRIIDDLEPEERNQVVADGALMAAMNSMLSKPNYERAFKVLTGQADLADRMLSRTIGNTWWKKHISGKPDQAGMKEDVRTYVRHLKLQFDKEVRGEVVAKLNGAEPSQGDRAAIEQEISRRVHEACANLAAGPTEKQVMDDVLDEEDKAEVRSIMLNDGEAKDFALVGGAGSDQILSEIKGMSDAERAAKLADPAYIQMLGQRLGKEKDYREAMNALSRTGGGSGGLASLDAKSRSSEQTHDAKRDPRETLRALAKLSPEELHALQDDPTMQAQVMAAFGDDDKMRGLARQMLEAPGFVVDPKTKDDDKAKAENQTKLFEFTKQQSIYRLKVASQTSNKWSVVLEEAIEVYKAHLEVLEDPAAGPKTPDPKAPKSAAAINYRQQVWDAVARDIATFGVDHDDHPGALTTQTKVTGTDTPLTGREMVKIVKGAVMRERDPSDDLVDSKIWTADEQKEQMSAVVKGMPGQVKGQFGLWTEDRYKEEDVLAAINAASDDKVASTWTSIVTAPVGGGPTMESTYKTFRASFDLAKSRIAAKEADDNAVQAKPTPQPAPAAVDGSATSDAVVGPPPLHWSSNIKQSYDDDPVIADAELKRRQFLEYTIKVGQPFEHMLRPYMGDNRGETKASSTYEPQLSGTGNKRYDTLKEALLARIPRLSPEVIGRTIHIDASDMWILKETAREEIGMFNLRHEKNLRSRGRNTSERSAASEEKQELDTSRIRYGREMAKALTTGHIDSAEKEKLDHLGDENDRARESYKTALEETAMWASLIIGTLVTIVATILTGGLALGPVAAMAIGAATAALSATAKAWVNRSILDTEFDSKDATEMITQEVLTSVMTIGTTFFAQKLLSAVSGLSTVARQANAARQVLQTPPPIWRVFLNQASEQVTSSMMNSVVEAGLEATDPMHFIDGYREGEKEARSAAMAKLKAAPKGAMEGAVTSLLSAAVGKVLRPKGGGGVHFNEAAEGKRVVNIQRNMKKVFGDPEQKVAGALVEWAMNQEGEIDWAKAPAELFAGTIRQYGQVSTEMHSTTAQTASRGSRARASMELYKHQMTATEHEAYMHMTAEAGGTDTFVSAKDFVEVRSKVAMTGLSVWEAQHPQTKLSDPQREAFVKYVRGAKDADGMAARAHEDPTTVPDVIKAAKPAPAANENAPHDTEVTPQPGHTDTEKHAATPTTAAKPDVPGAGHGGPGAGHDGPRNAADVLAGQVPVPGEVWTFKSKSGSLYAGKFGGIDEHGKIIIHTHEGTGHLDPTKLESARLGRSNEALHSFGPNDEITLYSVRGNPRTGRIEGYDEFGNILFRRSTGEMERLLPDQLDLHRTQRAQTELIHTGADAQAHLALAQQLGVMPSTSIKVANATFKVGQLFAISDGRVAVLIEVEVNGQRFMRVAYRSNSQGGFRILPATNDDPKMLNRFLPGYDKGTGEHTIMLPNEVEEMLARDLATNKVRRDIPLDQAEQAFKGAAPVNRSVEDYGKYENSDDHVKKSVKTEEILGKAQHMLPTPSGNKIASPGEVQVKVHGQRPNFKELVRSYPTNTAVAGDVTALVFRSHDGSLEYVLYQDAQKHVWIKSVSKVDSAITAQGVRDVAIDSKALTTPLWEYPKQLPNGPNREQHPTQKDYVNAWDYVSKIPEIQEFYKQTGTQMPGEEARQQARQVEQAKAPEIVPHANQQPHAQTPAQPPPQKGPAVAAVNEAHRVFGREQPQQGELWTVRSKSGNHYEGTFEGYDEASGFLILRNSSGERQLLNPERLDVGRRGRSHPDLHGFGIDDIVKLVSVRQNARVGRILGYDAEGNILFERTNADGSKFVEKLKPDQLDLVKTERMPGAGRDTEAPKKAAPDVEAKAKVDDTAAAERVTKPQQAVADPTEAHAKAAKPVTTNEEHRGPRNIHEEHPDVAKMSALPREALIAPHQQHLAEGALSRLSDADYARFKAVEATVTDPVARGFLYKALAAGNSVEDVHWLAGEMAGKDSSWLVDNLTLGDPRGVGVGIKQQWATSCNAAMAITMRGNHDPVFALKLRKGNVAVNQADEANPHAMNGNQAALEKKMLESQYMGDNPMSSAGHRGEAQPRSSRKGTGRFADDMLNEMSSVTGMSFKPEVHPSATRIVNVFERSLRQRLQVPFVVGDDATAQAHYLLAQDRRVTKGVIEYSIHDPWTGKAAWVKASDIESGNLPDGWKRIGTLEVPTAMSHEGNAAPRPVSPDAAPTHGDAPTSKPAQPPSPPSISEQAPKVASAALSAVMEHMDGGVANQVIANELESLPTTTTQPVDHGTTPTHANEAPAVKHVEVSAQVQVAVAEQVHPQALVAELALMEAVAQGKTTKGHEHDPARKAFTEAWKDKHVDLEAFLKQFDFEAEDAVSKIQRSMRANPKVAEVLSKVPQEELIAILLYTSSHFVEWNRTLRQADHSSLDEFGGGISLADKGLSKLPTYEGWTIRGTDLPDEVIAKYAVGQTVTEEGFTSTSVADAVSNQMFDKNVTFKILSKSGRDVQALSRYDHEKEVLFRPGTKFKVVDKVTEGGKVVITMVEDGGEHHAPGAGKKKTEKTTEKAAEKAAEKQPKPVEESNVAKPVSPQHEKAIALDLEVQRQLQMANAHDTAYEPGLYQLQAKVKKLRRYLATEHDEEMLQEAEHELADLTKELEAQVADLDTHAGKRQGQFEQAREDDRARWPDRAAWEHAREESIKILTSHEPAIRALIPEGELKFRGSTAAGWKGAHKVEKSTNTAQRWNPHEFDVDAFLVVPDPWWQTELVDKRIVTGDADRVKVDNLERFRLQDELTAIQTRIAADLGKIPGYQHDKSGIHFDLFLQPTKHAQAKSTEGNLYPEGSLENAGAGDLETTLPDRGNKKRMPDENVHIYGPET